MSEKPIDPTDLIALTDAYFGDIGEDGPTGVYAGGLFNVARAVLPEGYVAVPVADLRACLYDLASFRGEYRFDSESSMHLLRSLLPTEREATS